MPPPSLTRSPPAAEHRPRSPAPAAAPAYLLVLIAALNRARRLLARRQVRRSLDATTGAVLLGFSARLATEHA